MTKNLSSNIINPKYIKIKYKHILLYKGIGRYDKYIQSWLKKNIGKIWIDKGQ